MKNVYFSNQVKSEQDLYEDLIIESLQIYGQDIVYIPRTEISRDEILNESYSKFEDSYVVEMYIENQEGFEGDGDLLAKFGLEIRDQATFIVAKRRWDKQVSKWTNSIRPMEGDLLFLPMSNSLFEIKFVEHEQPFYQLNNLPIYKLQAELFEYGDEAMDTGIDAVDRIETLNATSFTYSLNSGSGDFTVGENVIQWSGENDVDGNAINIEGEVAAWDDLGATEGTLTVVAHVTTEGKFQKFYVDPSNMVTGTESGVSYAVMSTTLINSTNYNRDPYAANDFFEAEADNIIDFSETNPFGEP